MLGSDFRGGEVINGVVASALRLSPVCASGRRHVARRGPCGKELRLPTTNQHGPAERVKALLGSRFFRHSQGLRRLLFWPTA